MANARREDREDEKDVIGGAVKSPACLAQRSGKRARTTSRARRG